jgi:hypothetical protein
VLETAPSAHASTSTAIPARPPRDALTSARRAVDKQLIIDLSRSPFSR